MTNLAESLATDALKTCIFDSVKNVYSSIKSYKDNMKLLQDKMQILRAKKEDVARKVEVGESILHEVTSEASVWLQSVEALLEDEQVKDLVDEDLRRAKEQCCFGIFLCNLHQRYGMSRLAKSKVDEIKEKLAQLTEDKVTVPKRTMDLDPIPTQFCKGLDSRGMLEQRILELLEDDQVNAVGICGMGGVGKTTLAKDIKNKGAKDMFDAILMVEVSQVVNIECIQDHIAASIDLSLDSKHSLEQRATKLYNALKQVKPKGNNNDQRSKILIIMDNIWADLELDEVGIPHERTPQFCCKLLFTSRERRVCKSMGVPDKNIVDVSMLDENDSRLLFWEQIRNVDGNKVEKSIEGRLLRSCGGLPLAIVTLAKSLSGQDVAIWQHFADELDKPISCRSEDVHHDGTYKIIEASYKFIGNNKKKMFFLLACLYPFGSGILVENLMRYGIGLNLFNRADSLTDVIKQANRWTDELISSSLLLEDDDRYGGRKGKIWTEELISSPLLIVDENKYKGRRVKVHDVVRSYTILCAEKDGHKLMVEAIPQWQFGESWESYTAISLANDKDYSRLRGMRFDMLETLILTGSCHFNLDDHDDLFRGMARLKVLQLSRLRSCLPKSIITLTNLKTLHLEDCILQDGDIEMVSELVGLLVLSLRGSDVKTLPYGMKRLIHLRLLDLHKCSLTIIPADVLSNLTELEGLYMLNCYGSNWQDNNSEREQVTTASITELRLLHRLKVLEIQVKRIEQVTISDMEFITSFPKFKFNANRSERTEKTVKFSSVNFEVEIGYSLEWLWKHPCLKTLIAQSNHMTISKITDDEGLLKNLVPNLDREGFRFLEELQLNNLKGLNRICDGQVPPQMFCNLRYLKLQRLENLESYVLPIDVAPNLTALSVINCEKLKLIWMEHVAPFTQKELPCLKYLTLNNLPNLLHALGNGDDVKYSTSMDINQPQALFNVCKIVFPSMENLIIERGSMIEKLLEWDIPSPMQEIIARENPHFTPFPNLRKLYIREAVNMKTGIGSPSIAATLVHLETLQIGSCAKMTQVISEETKEEIESSSNIITFPKLEFLYLNLLHKLECMYGGSYEVEFPSLKIIEVKNVDNMTRFVGPENIAGFLPKKMFSNLQHLKLVWLEKLESYVLPIDVVPNLSTLSVVNCEKLKFIWMGNVTQKFYELPCLKYLKLANLGNLLQALGNDSDNSSTSIGINKLQPLFDTKIRFGSLEELEVKGSSMYEKVWEWDIPNTMQEISARAGPHFSPFPNLRKLYISNTYNIKIGLGSPFMAATLFHLQTLQIFECYKMKQVISEEKEETGSSSTVIITFPKLNFLKLSKLPKLKCMYGGSYQVEFPALKIMKLLDVPNMTKFVGLKNNADHLLSKKIRFPSLEDLTVKGSDIYEKLWEHDIHPMQENATHFCPFPNLRKLYIEDHNNMKTVLASPSIASTLIHLETLQIISCENMKQVIGEEIEDETEISSNILTFPKLKLLKLTLLPKLECIYGGGYKVVFPTLKKLELDSVSNLTRFVGSENTVNFLPEKVEFPSLEELKISNETPVAATPSMVNLYFPFRILRDLNLEFLKWKHAFSKDIDLTELTNLERLKILGFENMEAVMEELDETMPSSSLSSSPYLEFPRLRTIHLINCSKLRWFFSTRHAQIALLFPSLREVFTHNCNDMELFSNGPIEVPKLATFLVYRSAPGVHKDFRMKDGDDLNNFLHNSYKYFHP